MSILVIAEHDNKQIKPATLNVLGAATQIGGEIHVLVIGGNCAEAAQAGAKIAGVSKVRVVDAAHYADHTAENIAIAAAQLAGSYSHVLLPASSFGKNLGPRLAALLDVAQVSDIVGVVSADTFVRPIYAGSALATVQSGDPVKVITVRVSAFDAVQADVGSAVIEAAPAGPDLGVSKLIGRELTVSARPSLAAARVVISGGTISTPCSSRWPTNWGRPSVPRAPPSTRVLHRTKARLARPGRLLRPICILPLAYLARFSIWRA
jgi:electron transfer flavoprotein alpha subunit